MQSICEINCINRAEIAFRLASAILLHNGEVSFSDIGSIPFVNNDEEIENVLALLLKRYKTELASRLISTTPFLITEAVVRLRSR